MAKPDGGPAFPATAVYQPLTKSLDQITAGGMSLRDYFAGQALTGLIASNDEGAGDRLTEIPRYAYWIADAMLEAREKE